MKPQLPPPQHNLQDATDKAVAALAGQSAEQMVRLGAERTGDTWRLRVLNDLLDVDITGGQALTSAGKPVRPAWRLLVLHYLVADVKPDDGAPEITFADLPAARAYASVYQQRVNSRLCATAGRDLATLRDRADAIGARPAAGGDAAFDIKVFPRITTRLIWYAADDEFPPSATLLLTANIERFFCVEDIVVMSELIVSRLSGQPF